MAPAPAINLSGMDPLAMIRALGFAGAAQAAPSASGQIEEVESSDDDSDDSQSAPMPLGGSWLRQQMGGLPSDPSPSKPGNTGTKAWPA